MSNSNNYPNPYFSVATIIFSMGLIQCGFGLLNVLAPALLTQAGYSASMIGLHASLSSAGFMLGTLVAPALIGRIGHIRAFAVFAAVDAIGALAMSIAVDLWLWTVVRAVMGFALSGLFTVCESWISGNTQMNMRGRVLAAYILVYKLASAGAPMVIYLLPPPSGPAEIIRYFMITSAFFSIAVIPIALTKSKAPQISTGAASRLSLPTIYKIAPAAFIACVLSALSNSSVNSLIPVYATLLGFGVAGSALFFSVMQTGNIILQWPAGWLSDIIDRRRVIVLLAAIVTIDSLLIGFFGQSLPQWGLIILLIIWGGAAMSIYAVCVAHAGDNAQPEQMVSLSSTMLLSFSIGMIIGPLWAGQLISWFGPDTLFYNSAFMNALIVIFVLWRLRVRKSKPASDRERFVNLPATSFKLSGFHPRTPEEPISHKRQEE